MGEIEGRPAELIDRLIELLNNDALGERMWYQVGGSAQDAVGGQVLPSEPDTGKEPVPGTGAYELRRHSPEFVTAVIELRDLRNKVAHGQHNPPAPGAPPR